MSGDLQNVCFTNLFHVDQVLGPGLPWMGNSFVGFEIVFGFGFCFEYKQEADICFPWALHKSDKYSAFKCNRHQLICFTSASDIFLHAASMMF